jgi:hypothetical protein
MARANAVATDKEAMLAAVAKTKTLHGRRGRKRR